MARLRGQPTRKTAITFDMTMARDVASPLVNAAMGFMGHLRFDYRVSDRQVLYASVESFEQNQNAYVLAPLSRNRFMVGIQISLSSETDRRLNHLNEDAAYVALTDHQRRHPAPQ